MHINHSGSLQIKKSDFDIHEEMLWVKSQLELNFYKKHQLVTH